MPTIDVYTCAKYVLKEGVMEKERDSLANLKTELKIKKGKIVN